jgi:hypothetical protein
MHSPGFISQVLADGLEEMDVLLHTWPQHPTSNPLRESTLTNHLPPPWMMVALKDATGALWSYWMCKQESKHSGSALKQRKTQALNTYTRGDVSRPAVFDSNGVDSLCVWCCISGEQTMLYAECLDRFSNYLAISCWELLNFSLPS